MFPPLALVPSDSPILRTPCRPVRADEMSALCDPKFLYRIDKFRRQCNGIGLAAPQIGDNRQYFVFATHAAGAHGELVINPRIAFRSGHTALYSESCLSFPGKFADVERPTEIGVEYTDGSGLFSQRHLHNWDARVFLHEFDHLQGTCIL